jgi:hypothetical protein
MALTSVFMSYATLIVHSSLIGILLIVNPFSVQALKELYLVLYVCPTLLQCLQTPYGTCSFTGVLPSYFEEEL